MKQATRGSQGPVPVRDLPAVRANESRWLAGRKAAA
jgi:hypothetical protein